MPVESLHDLAADATTAIAGARAASEAARATLTAGSYTPASLNNLRATLTGHRADLRAIRSDLDASDVASFQHRARADRSIALWAWERSTRRTLLRVEDQLRRAEDLADLVALGVRRVVYVVRHGDTLQSIAAKHLGDWREYPRIVEANGLTPGALTPGTVLTIPEKR